MNDRAQYKQHRRAYFWFGNVTKWMQHKSMCTVCTGYEQGVAVAPQAPTAPAPAPVLYTCVHVMNAPYPCPACVPSAYPFVNGGQQ